MGTGSHSKLAAPQLPARPFEKSSRLQCWQEALLSPMSGGMVGDGVYQKAAKTKKATLQQLILRHDWQRVLIRANLYPEELRLPFGIHLYGIDLQVLPLHLILTLDPPLAVVELFLKHYVDATAMTIHPCPTTMARKPRSKKKKKKSFWAQRKPLKHSFRRWNERSHGAFLSVELGAVSTDDDWMYDDYGQEEEHSQHGTMSVEQRRFLIPHVARIPGEEESVYYTPPGENTGGNYPEVVGEDEFKSIPSLGSSLSSEEEGHAKEDEDYDTENGNDHDDDDEGSVCSAGPGVILQLSPSGGLADMPIVHKSDEETESSSGSSGHDDDDDDDDDDDGSSNNNKKDGRDNNSSGELFRVEWDLDPLLQVVADRGGLLPIHIACLFEASAQVLEALVHRYPLGALRDVSGMLPIHLISAGWNLPIIFEPPPESSLAIMSVKREKPGLLESLRVLVNAVPDSLTMKSENHSLTPPGYIDECMEDVDYKQTCLRLLLSEEDNQRQDLIGGTKSKEGGEMEVAAGSSREPAFADSLDVSTLPSKIPDHKCMVAGLSSLILKEDWARALAVVEDDPQTAQKWYYGVEEDDPGKAVWKRLPIHLACMNQNTPIGFMDVLLSAYPIGAALEDPQDGSLPLHMLCRVRADLSHVKLLLSSCPEATKAVDIKGRSALNLAVIHHSPFNVVQFLLQTDPESLVVSDQCSKTPIDYAMEGEDAALRDLLSMVLKLLEKQSHHMM